MTRTLIIDQDRPVPHRSAEERPTNGEKEERERENSHDSVGPVCPPVNECGSTTTIRQATCTHYTLNEAANLTPRSRFAAATEWTVGRQQQVLFKAYTPAQTYRGTELRPFAFHELSLSLSLCLCAQPREWSEMRSKKFIWKLGGEGKREMIVLRRFLEERVTTGDCYFFRSTWYLGAWLRTRLIRMAEVRRWFVKPRKKKWLGYCGARSGSRRMKMELR